MLKHLLLLSVIFMVVKTQAQNVGIGTPNPNASALLDISSNNKGLLMPRMSSAQRNAIVAPAKGLMAFDSSQNSFWYYTGSGWKEIAGNNYNSDTALLLGQQAGTIASHNLTVNSYSSDSSGYLYDSGGPSGNYGNNENFTYTIYPSGYQLATDIIVLSNNLESTYDSLIVTDDVGHRYVLLGTTTGSHRIFGTVHILFKSNSSNTLSGFAIRWNDVFPGSKNNYDSSQTTGWYYNSAKNYMRGGTNANNNWSPDSSGMYSFAFGYNNKAIGYSGTALGYRTIASGSSSAAIGDLAVASGHFSTAMGYSTTANGQYSIAMGGHASASGISSTAIGDYTTASGDYSTAMNSQTKAIGYCSIATGNLTTASGTLSTALGSNTTASGYFSTAMGDFTTSSGSISTAMGFFTKSKSFGGVSIGLYNDSTNAADAINFNPLNRIFEIGNGSADNARSNAMTVLQNGNTGIGTTNPTSTLDVNGPITIEQKNFGGYAGLLIKGNSPVSNYPNIGFSTQNNAATDMIAAGIGAAINNNTAGAEAMDLSFYTSTTGLAGLTERVRIKDNGNVGIGEINPTVPLNFAASLGNKISLWGTDANHYGMGVQNYLMQFYSADYGDDIAFGYGSSAAFTENVRMKGNGNVGIGTNKPGAMLTVKKDINVDNGDGNAGTTDNTLKFGGNGSGEAIGSNRTTATNQYGLDFYTFGANRMSITLGGNVGIGTTAPSAKLSVNGSANNATGNWGVFSDARVKNITGNFTDGLNVISQINPIVFNYNENAPFKTSDEQIGIVAQDLEKIAPYMVSKQAYNQFADLREVNNQAYVFLLINAVKDQQQQIEAQRKKNVGQQDQIETQQKENTLQQKRFEEQQQRIDKLEKLVKELSGKFN
jgi:polyhydroxyalkanoate synthesis regulator phasin